MISRTPTLDSVLQPNTQDVPIYPWYTKPLLLSDPSEGLFIFLASVVTFLISLRLIGFLNLAGFSLHSRRNFSAHVVPLDTTSIRYTSMSLMLLAPMTNSKA